MNRNKQWTGFLLIILMIYVLSGCGNRDESKTLTVFTETTLLEHSKSLADYFKMEHPDMEITVFALSENPEEREAEIQKLRTEITAGHGPDIYILSSEVGSNKNNIKLEQLFDNVYKVMKSGTFADLSSQIQNDADWKSEDFVNSIMDAGKLGESQYVIPLFYDIVMLQIDSETAKKAGFNQIPSTLDDLREAAKQSKNDDILYAFNSFAEQLIQRYIAASVDYEQEQVLLSKENLLELLEKDKTFANQYRNLPYKEDSNANIIRATFLNTGQKELIESSIFINCSVEGKEKLASILQYGAIGRNCKYKDEAYEYLKLFLNPTIQQGEQLEKDNRFYGSSSMVNGIPVVKSAQSFWLNNQYELFGDKLEDSSVESLLNTIQDIDRSSILNSLNTFADDLLTEWRYDAAKETISTEEITDELMKKLEITATE